MNKDELKQTIIDEIIRNVREREAEILENNPELLIEIAAEQEKNAFKKKQKQK